MKEIRIEDFEKPVQSEAMQAIIEQLKGTDIALDKQSILTMAKEQLDVDIDEDDELLDRFDNLFKEIFENGPVHEAGKYLLQQTVVGAIVQNSRMKWIREKHPEISETPLQPPLIVAGMPRSGTTYLQQLLSSDPDFVSLSRWEAIQSFPSRAVLEGREKDNRKVDATNMLNAAADTLPLLLYMYGSTEDEAHEEIALQTNGCYGVSMTFYGDVPNFDEALYSVDQSDGYRYLYKYLQTLQWVKKRPTNQRWLLKSPQHMGMLTSLDAVFPDATVIFTHRDPASVFYSLFTMIGYILRRTYSNLTIEQIMGVTKRMQHGFLRGVVADADKFEGRSEHIYFNEFMGDYQGTIEKVYAVSGMNYDNEVKARVDNYAKGLTRGRLGGRLVYDLEKTLGIKRDALREEFSYYLEKFPATIEGTQQ